MKLRCNGSAVSRLLLLCLAASAHSASAFYDPSVQRWINRDPISDEGAILRTSTPAKVFVGKLWRNVAGTPPRRGGLVPVALLTREYVVLMNSPIMVIDPDGREVYPNGVPPPAPCMNPCLALGFTEGECCRAGCWARGGVCAGLCAFAGLAPPAAIACAAACETAASLCSDTCPP
jgi:hypothetical protein